MIKFLVLFIVFFVIGMHVGDALSYEPYKPYAPQGGALTSAQENRNHDMSYGSLNDGGYGVQYEIRQLRNEVRSQNYFNAPYPVYRPQVRKRGGN